MASGSGTFPGRVAEFLSTTDTHGVKFVSRANKVRSVFWCVALVASVSFLVYFFNIRVASYLKYEVATRTTVTTDHVPFPKVSPLFIFSYSVGYLTVLLLTTEKLLLICFRHCFGGVVLFGRFGKDYLIGRW